MDVISQALAAADAGRYLKKSEALALADEVRRLREALAIAQNEGDSLVGTCCFRQAESERLLVSKPSVSHR